MTHNEFESGYWWRGGLERKRVALPAALVFYRRISIAGDRYIARQSLVTLASSANEKAMVGAG